VFGAFAVTAYGDATKSLAGAADKFAGQPPPDDPSAHLWRQASHPGPPSGEDWGTYWFFAVALSASAMTPYEVFFFSSGAVEERWGRKDLLTARINVFLGFPLGGLLAFALMATSAIVFHPLDTAVDSLSQTAMPVALALGKLGLAAVILGFFAATFGAAMETGLSAGYTVAQYFGWAWGKLRKPREAARFHTVVMVSILGQKALGGRLGRWIAGTARRLAHDYDDGPIRNLVAEINSAINLSVRRELLPDPALEAWLRDHLVGRIPGASDAG
jgi:hypothetical protein